MLQKLINKFSGEILLDSLSKTIYSYDGSIYEKRPMAVVLPKNKEDIIELVKFTEKNNLSIIPRTAGTSLGGQVVGHGIVADVSKYMNKILEIDKENKWVRVQPGIVRDELNLLLEPHNLFFGVNTSTSNRAMIGGMVGNNSSGSLSIVYGTTRDNLLEIEAVLANGDVVKFGSKNKNDFENICKQNDKEGYIYSQIDQILKNKTNQKEIENNFPKKSIHRRNTGYALDKLLECERYNNSEKLFNFCNLIAGSEGTLVFITEIKLKLNPLPPPKNVVVCCHFNSLIESLESTVISMKHQPYSCELMDKFILDCTKKNIKQSKNRFFIEGDPSAIIAVEFRGETLDEAIEKADKLIADLKNNKKGYAYTKVENEQTKKVWELRAAGLGLLANISKELSAVESIEDTAVDVQDLPKYIYELNSILNKLGQNPVYYAHAGAGELHIRPTLNLKKTEDVKLLKEICLKTFELVKKYNGSISGEHGDGIIRSEFIKDFYGEKINNLLIEVKNIFDHKNIFNPGKIVNPYKMDESLRVQQIKETPEIKTAFDFSSQGGMQGVTEKCTGSGDCRKNEIFGGVMCPSFMATKNEKDTTRARANALRKIITSNKKDQIFKSKEANQVLDLCLSCKGCTAECPSNVDMAMLKSEFLFQKNKNNVFNFRAMMFAYQPLLNSFIAKRIGRSFYIWLLKNNLFQILLKNSLKIHKKRTIPIISEYSLRSWFEENKNIYEPINKIKTVYFFCDEFINEIDSEIGQKAIKLLWKLGYQVEMPMHSYSGRSLISKGFLKQAKIIAKDNVNLFSKILKEDENLVGIEPSAILTFKDEYVKLLRGHEQITAKKLAESTLLLDDFIAKEYELGNIKKSQFNNENKKILLHGHCHQKSLVTMEGTKKMLSILNNTEVEVIPSGCCGMAGSFGYEKEHYETSKKISELVLIPAIKKAEINTIICATGLSCREQINDFTERKALHPVEIMMDSFINK